MESPHVSSVFAALIKQVKSKESFSLQEIIGAMGGRMFGMPILLFCIPNVLPIPNIAGLSALTGIPIGILGLQMAFGQAHPWLPAALGKKQFSSKRFEAFLERAIPIIRKIEVLLHPRLHIMSAEAMQRLLGVAFVVLATVMSLPIPFGNFLPGLAMALMAIGLIERDGLLVVLGLLVGTATVAFMFSVADAILSAMQSFFG